MYYMSFFGQTIYFEYTNVGCIKREYFYVVVQNKTIWNKKCHRNILMSAS